MTSKEWQLVAVILVLMLVYQYRTRPGPVPNNNGTPTIPLGGGQGNEDAFSSAPMPSLFVGKAVADTLSGLDLLG